MEGNEMAVQKIRSGIPGLDKLMDGGLNRNSTSVVIGASGTGKTTFALQFLRRGLEEGSEAIHITLDETKEQIISEAINLGWRDIEDYVESEKLIFMEAAGSDFLDFIENEFPDLIANWEGSTDARIVIDPLTPVMWSVKDIYRQREIISSLFKLTRKIGTVLATLEEHNTFGTLQGSESILPMYIADSVFHLSYVGLGFSINRMLKIVKCRSSWHTEVSNPYNIIPGIGLAVHVIEGAYKKESEVPREVLEYLKKGMADLPPDAQARIKDVVRQMNKKDIGIFNFQELAQLLIEEYK
jgi:circadian clock protein KaiC